MKTLTILFCFIYYLGNSQVVFRMNMNVRIASDSCQIGCRNIRVFWGIKEDTIGFAWEDKTLIFYQIGSSARNKLGKKIDYYESITDANMRGDKLYILQDYKDDIYAVRIVRGNLGGIAIFVTNVKRGCPNYIFSWQCNKCD